MDVAPAPEPLEPPPPAPADTRVDGPWPAICERFALQLLGHVESLRPALDRLEADEHDEERLQWLYDIDHSVTCMRRVVRDMRVLAGVEEGDLGGYLSSLVDVVRVAESSIEHYSKVILGKAVDLGVVSYASDDISLLLAALLDNATRYSPSMVTVSAHLLESGSVMLRVEDNGIGIPPSDVEVLNTTLSGPVPTVDEHTGKHTGFPVVHRLARKHGVSVRLASRFRSGTGAPGGTIAMVTIPADLVCELPDEGPAIGRRTESDEASGVGSREAPSFGAQPIEGETPMTTWPTPTPAPEPAPEPKPEPEPYAPGGLPRRTRTSLRGKGGAHSRTREKPAEAAKSFAEDLTAFTTGEQAVRQGPAGAEEDHVEGEGR